MSYKEVGSSRHFNVFHMFHGKSFAFHSLPILPLLSEARQKLVICEVKYWWHMQYACDFEAVSAVAVVVVVVIAAMDACVKFFSIDFFILC